MVVSACLMSPPAPPTPMKQGTTKDVRDNQRYQDVFDKCIAVTPKEAQQCRWSAQEASETTMYWDGTGWVLPTAKPL